MSIVNQYKISIQNWLFKRIRHSILKHENSKSIFVYILINNFLSKTKLHSLKLVPYNLIRENEEIVITPKTISLYGQRPIYEPTPIKIKKTKNIGFKKQKNQIVNINNNISFDLKKKVAYYQQAWDERRNKYVKLDGGHVLINNEKILIGKIHKDISNIEKGIVLHGFWFQNWYHWLVEIVSKHEIIKRLPEDAKDYPLLIPKLNHESNHYKLIKLLFPEYNLVELNETKTYQVKNLYVVDSVVGQPPNYRFLDTQEEYEDNLLEPELFNEYINTLKTKLIYNSHNIKSHQKLFLARKQNRRSYNQDEIEAALIKVGFKSIYLEDYSLIEQANIMHNADFIVGATGAAWANMVFCKPQTKCIIWTPDCTKDATTYSNLAENLNLNIRFVYFETGTKSWREFMSKKGQYNLKIDDLQQALLSLESNN